MENNCVAPCEDVRKLRRSFDGYREGTERRLAQGDVALATINTKLNWLIAILAAVGTALLGVLLKLAAGA